MFLTYPICSWHKIEHAICVQETRQCWVAGWRYPWHSESSLVTSASLSHFSHPSPSLPYPSAPLFLKVQSGFGIVKSLSLKGGYSDGATLRSTSDYLASSSKHWGISPPIKAINKKDLPPRTSGTRSAMWLWGEDATWKMKVCSKTLGTSSFCKAIIESFQRLWS